MKVNIQHDQFSAALTTILKADPKAIQASMDADKAERSARRKLKNVSAVYRNGDIHPVHHLSAFVEYDQGGREIWTSIAIDPEAPKRLLTVNDAHLNRGKYKRTRTPDADTSPLDRG